MDSVKIKELQDALYDARELAEEASRRHRLLADFKRTLEPQIAKSGEAVRSLRSVEGVLAEELADAEAAHASLSRQFDRLARMVREAHTAMVNTSAASASIEARLRPVWAAEAARSTLDLLLQEHGIEVGEEQEQDQSE